MSDNQRNTAGQGEQKIIITDRKSLELQGVSKVEDFDKDEIHVITNLGDLLIRGTDLHIAHLLLDEEQMVVTGEINSVAFVEPKGKHKKNSLFERLTK